MNNDKSFGFIGGFLLGGMVGAAAALLLAPFSGKETRDQIRAEGVALTQRGQEFGDDKMHEMQKMVKQGKRGAADAQTRLGRALEDQKDNLRETIRV